MSMLRFRSRFPSNMIQRNKTLRTVMTCDRVDENDPGSDGDFPHQELLQIYIAASVFMCVWLAMALFFSELPQKLFGYAVHIAS